MVRNLYAVISQTQNRPHCLDNLRHEKSYLHRDIDFQAMLPLEDFQVLSHPQCYKRVLSSSTIMVEQQDPFAMCNGAVLPRYVIENASK